MRGFNCNDETIRYPYKDSTVSSGVCYFVGSGVNILLILVVEYLNLTTKSRLYQGSTSSTRQEIDHEKLDSHIYFKNVYCRLIVWLFGAISSELLTDIAKVTAGRLRPHFIEVCQPKIKGLTVDYYCKNSDDKYAYITDYECTGIPKKQRDARLSFLSGHSSYSAYSATYAMLYIQDAIDINKYGLLKPALQVLIASAAFYTGLSRVSDYKHHWQDVLAGLLLGTLVASFATVYVFQAVFKAYTRYTDRSSSNKQAEPNEAPAAELNRLGY